MITQLQREVAERIAAHGAGKDRRRAESVRRNATTIRAAIAKREMIEVRKVAALQKRIEAYAENERKRFERAYILAGGKREDLDAAWQREVERRAVQGLETPRKLRGKL